MDEKENEPYALDLLLHFAFMLIALFGSTEIIEYLRIECGVRAATCLGMSIYAGLYSSQQLCIAIFSTNQPDTVAKRFIYPILCYSGSCIVFLMFLVFKSFS